MHRIFAVERPLVLVLRHRAPSSAEDAWEDGLAAAHAVKTSDKRLPMIHEGHRAAWYVDRNNGRWEPSVFRYQWLRYPDRVDVYDARGGGVCGSFGRVYRTRFEREILIACEA